MTNKKSAFDSLPNELLLIIFSYLSSFDLCQAFLYLKNARIQYLLTSLRHSLNVSLMHYNQLYHWLNSNQDDINRFTTLINTVVLDNSCACRMLYVHWGKTLDQTEQSNVLFPSIKQIFILNADYYTCGFTRSILIPLVLDNNTLQYLHMIFKELRDDYSLILSQLVCHRISVHTMILEVEQGHKYSWEDPIEGLHNMEPLSWPNTVQLTLSIQHSSELRLLFQRNALPVIEQLNVTNENQCTALLFHTNKSIQDNLREKSNDAIYLKCLILRYMMLRDVVSLIGPLTMPLLEKLILIDMYDDTLNYIDQFQELCSSTHLPSLKNLHFSLCFPQEIESVWRMSSFNCNRQWPFNNIDSYLDDCYIRTQERSNLIPKTLFVVYNHPIDVLFRYKRTFYNYDFTTHVSTRSIRTIRRRLIQWTCDQKFDIDQYNKTLQIISSGHVNQLHLTYLNERTNISKASNCLSHGNFTFNYIRSIILNIESDSMKKYERIVMMERILDASPNLSHLVVAWEDFRHTRRQYPKLRHLHIMLNRGYYENSKDYFNFHRLIELTPHLYFLKMDDTIMMLNENLIEFILNIIRQFDQLVHLTLNKNCNYASRYKKKVIFRDKLIAALHNQLCHWNNNQFVFGRNNELRIWL